MAKVRIISCKIVFNYLCNIVMLQIIKVSAKLNLCYLGTLTKSPLWRTGHRQWMHQRSWVQFPANILPDIKLEECLTVHILCFLRCIHFIYHEAKESYLFILGI